MLEKPFHTYSQNTPSSQTIPPTGELIQSTALGMGCPRSSVSYTKCLKTAGRQKESRADALRTPTTVSSQLSGFGLVLGYGADNGGSQQLKTAKPKIQKFSKKEVVFTF